MIKFHIKDQKVEPTTVLELITCTDGGVVLQVSRSGKLWDILKLKVDGSFYRFKNVSSGAGFQTNSDNEIFESGIK